MKRIVIVGASSGLGRRIAGDFAARGWRVGVAARREAPLLEIQARFPGLVEHEVLDVTADDAPRRLEALIERLGGMDVFLLAAGVGHQNPDLEPQIDLSTVDVNCRGFVNMVDSAYRYFRSLPAGSGCRPQIAVITSVAGTKGLGMAASYSASKRFGSCYLTALEQLAHIEGLKVSFTDIRPGFIRTPLLSPDKKYPMLMTVDHAAPLIERAILRRKRIAIIDWRWRLLVGVWRMIPHRLWTCWKIRMSL